ncbi:MAG: hypothetical protein Q8N36_01015, partial [bacterium]|nr:hypothetical protein [bacterium]
MIKTNVASLEVGKQVRGHYFVTEKRLINYFKDGAPATGLTMNLGDKSGRVSGVTWNEVLVNDNSYKNDDII